MKLKTIFALIIGLIVIQSCNTKVDTIPFYKLSDEFKSYCLFQQGSSWEYNSTLLSEPSSYGIAAVNENQWTNTYNERFSYEAIDMIMGDNQLGVSMIEITAGSTLNSTSSMNSLMWVFYSDGDYRLVFAPQYPLGEEQILGEHEGIYENVEIIPSLQLGENTYTDVYHTKVTDHFDNGMGDFDFYIAKYHGLVKMQNIVAGDTIVVQLKSSSLIQ